jgi:hypothetical protein
MEQFKIRQVCLAGLCMMAVFAFGAAGSASAAPLLFIPHTGKFPYHLAGIAGKAELEQTGGLTGITSEKVDLLALVLSPTLFDAKFTFLESHTSAFGTPTNCNNEGNETSSTILLSLLGHLGFADPGNVPAVLLLVPTGFDFKCFNLPIVGSVLILVKGGVIGQITKPGLNAASEELLINLSKSTKAVQSLRTFLLGGQTLTSDLESSISEASFELASQTGHGTLKALAGEGTFLLVSP